MTWCCIQTLRLMSTTDLVLYTKLPCWMLTNDLVLHTNAASHVHK
jgi:hypothetical protein